MIDSDAICRCGHFGRSHGDEDDEEPDESCGEPGCPCVCFTPAVSEAESAPLELPPFALQGASDPAVVSMFLELLEGATSGQISTRADALWALEQAKHRLLFGEGKAK